MALSDLLSRYEEGRKSIADVLARQKEDIPASLDRAKSMVEGERGSFFRNKLNPIIESVSGKLGRSPTMAPEARGLAEGRLGRTLDRGLATRRRGMANQGVSQGFEQAFNEAVHAGLNEQSAREYAFKVSEQGKEQEVYSGMAESARTAASEREDILDRNAASMKGIDQDSYQPFSASDLVMAQLLGLGTAVGTGYALNKYGGRKSTPSSTITPGSYADRLQNEFSRSEVRPLTKTQSWRKY